MCDTTLINVHLKERKGLEDKLSPISAFGSEEDQVITLWSSLHLSLLLLLSHKESIWGVSPLVAALQQKKIVPDCS